MYRIFVNRFDANARLIEWIDFDGFLFARIHYIEREYGSLIVIVCLDRIGCIAFVLNKILIVNCQLKSCTLENCSNRMILATITIDPQIGCE